MKQRVLQNGRLLASLEATLTERYDVHPFWAETDPQAFLAAHGAEFTGYACSARQGTDAAMMADLVLDNLASFFASGAVKVSAL